MKYGLAIESIRNTDSRLVVAPCGRVQVRLRVFRGIEQNGLTNRAVAACPCRCGKRRKPWDGTRNRTPGITAVSLENVFGIDVVLNAALGMAHGPRAVMIPTQAKLHRQF